MHILLKGQECSFRDAKNHNSTFSLSADGFHNFFFAKNFQNKVFACFYGIAY
jgi:hypothetical protein